ncbi:hypothetical protein UCRPC4_g05558 [Phaeomoniella chlamydospora]|uniref:Uncharacterized protein n=1 Tax=Phaeomoniella chlamydospora TaxID=158046 RepID=A0A0G2E522_PHACM|nr:hypothetical protein UCRPC4_g05558 [Phaeomoniella chlamydospora]
MKVSGQTATQDPPKNDADGPGELRKIRFDVVFADAKPSDKPFYSSSSLPSNTTTPVSFDNPFATAHWWSPSPIPPPPPPFLEETQLSQEIPDLVRVLQSGGMIRHLTIRLRKWPRWANGKPVIQSSEFYEVPECTVEDMLEVFRPLIEFQLQGIENDEVKVRAEVYKKTENENENAEGYDNPTTKFVEKFNLARRKFLDDTNAKESAVGSSCSSTDLALAHTTDVVIVQEKKHFEVPPVVDQYYCLIINQLGLEIFSLYLIFIVDE